MRLHRTILETGILLPPCEGIARFLAKVVAPVFPSYKIRTLSSGGVLVTVWHNGTEEGYRQCRRIALAYEAFQGAEVILASKEIAAR